MQVNTWKNWVRGLRLNLAPEGEREAEVLSYLRVAYEASDRRGYNKMSKMWICGRGQNFFSRSTSPSIQANKIRQYPKKFAQGHGFRGTKRHADNNYSVCKMWKYDCFLVDVADTVCRRGYYTILQMY
jgi:hypothetical protein